MRTLIDIGSMRGEEIAWGIKNGYEVHAFEPNPNLSNKLFSEFGNVPNVYLNFSAAWNRDGKADLHLMFNPEPGEDGVSLLPEKTNVSLEDTVPVDTVNIGKYLKNLDKDIDILKINAEGAEYIILESILNYFNPKRIKHWLVEDHMKYISSTEWMNKRDDVLKRLRELGIEVVDYKFDSLIKSHELLG